MFVGRTFSAFAAAALLLAAVGAYGLVAYGVAQRRKEIGVRLALGASGTDILRHFVGSGVRLALAGALAGAPLAIATARWLEHELFRVSPWDAANWIALPAVIVIAVLAASYVPARRASRMDPALTLRQE
jgi:putative ABC transport system permease protein